MGAISTTHQPQLQLHDHKSGHHEPTTRSCTWEEMQTLTSQVTHGDEGAKPPCQIWTCLITHDFRLGIEPRGFTFPCTAPLLVGTSRLAMPLGPNIFLSKRSLSKFITCHLLCIFITSLLAEKKLNLFITVHPYLPYGPQFRKCSPSLQMFVTVLLFSPSQQVWSYPVGAMSSGTACYLHLFCVSFL